jgi:hypothetical protein
MNSSMGKRPTDNPWPLRLFIIVVFLGSLFNVFALLVIVFVGGAIQFDPPRRDNRNVTDMLFGVLLLILAGYGLFFIQLVIRKWSTARRQWLLIHGFLFSIIEALLLWASLVGP